MARRPRFLRRRRTHGEIARRDYLHLGAIRAVAEHGAWHAPRSRYRGRARVCGVLWVLSECGHGKDQHCRKQENLYLFHSKNLAARERKYDKGFIFPAVARRVQRQWLWPNDSSH